MANFSPIDLAYAAGIIDGEGSIGITEISARANHPKRPRKNPQHRIYVAVAMTEAAIPMLLAEMFGGTTHTYHYNPSRHRAQTRWSLSGPRAVAALEALSPYLKIKRSQAEIAIKFQTQFITPNKHRKNTVPDELAERRALMSEVQALNSGVASKGVGRA